MTYVQRLNGSLTDLDEIGIRTKDFIVHSPSYNHTTDEIAGADGVVDLGTTTGPREITCIFRMIADDFNSFGDKRDEVFDLFESKDPLYLIEKRRPEQRWKAKVAESYDIDQKYVYGNFEVPFIAFSGYAESIGTTAQSSTFEHLDLPVTYTDYKDIHATRFRVYNAGKMIDPRSIHNYLKITYKGESESLRIKNKTTGDEWAYNGSSNEDDTIVLEGIRSTKNGLSIFRETNKRLITLARGWNEFEISGAPDAQRYAVQANMPRKKIPDELKPNPITFEFKYRW